jgi:hypothetical protein
MQIGNHTILYNRTGLNLGEIKEAVRVCLEANGMTRGKVQRVIVSRLDWHTDGTAGFYISVDVLTNKAIHCLGARMEYNANTQQFSATSVY